MAALRVRLRFWQLITRLSYFSQVFLQKKRTSVFFCGWTSTWSRTHIFMTLTHLTAHFSWPLPFPQSQKVVTFPLFPPPPPLLISDKCLSMRIKSSETLASFKNQQVREVDIENHPKLSPVRTVTCVTLRINNGTVRVFEFVCSFVCVCFLNLVRCSQLVYSACKLGILTRLWSLYW